MNFQGKSVIVTGASSGMGRAAAVQFAAHGARVVVNYSSSKDLAEETAEIIRKAGGTAIVCQGDVSEDEDARRVVKTAVDAFGRLDVLINNAGTTAFIPFDDLESAGPEVWLKLYSVNVVGSFLCARAAAPEMKKNGGGVVINNASVSGHRPQGSSIPYCSSKAAVLHMTRCLAIALGPEIRVCSVSPGYIKDTLWTSKRENFDAEKAAQEGARMSLLGKTGTASDIADAMLYLASDEAKFCTGIDVLVDGGRFFKV